jgi:G3E family GTPase
VADAAHGDHDQKLSRARRYGKRRAAVGSFRGAGAVSCLHRFELQVFIDMDGDVRNKASVIILTGFLGAGKTTLLNRILTSQQGSRTAVVVNEFGQVGIDHHLLLGADQKIVQMNNGCICCTVRGDLIGNLFQLLEHRSKFDRIVIETSGLAEPGPVAQALYADERIRREFTLDSVVTVVDAKHFSGQIEESAEARGQIAFADLILLNKTDLSTPETLDQLEKKIGDLNRIAKVYRTKNSDIDLKTVLAPESAELAQRIDSARAERHSVHHHDHDHHHHHRDHQHLDVSTVCLVEPGDLDGRKLSAWLRSLIKECGADILRMKGILSLRNDPDQFLFQGVQMEFEGRPGRAWGADEERVNSLVLIGRGLDQEKIAKGFGECVASGEVEIAPNRNPFDSNDALSPHTLDQIRYWMRQNFAFSADAPIVIKEVPCVKPGCPPVETAIVVILPNEPPRHFKIQRTINEITFDHVYNLIENPMPCC